MVVTITGSKAVLAYPQHVETLGRVLEDLKWKPTKILIGDAEVGADRLAFKYAETAGIPTSIVHKPPGTVVRDPHAHQNEGFMDKSSHVLIITEQPAFHLRRLLDLAAQRGKVAHWRRWTYPDGIQEYVRRVEVPAPLKEGDLLLSALESTLGMPFEVVVDGAVGSFEVRWPRHPHHPIEIRMSEPDTRRLRGAASAAVRDFANLRPGKIPSAMAVAEFLRRPDR